MLKNQQENPSNTVRLAAPPFGCYQPGNIPLKNQEPYALGLRLPEQRGQTTKRTLITRDICHYKGWMEPSLIKNQQLLYKTFLDLFLCAAKSETFVNKESTTEDISC